MIKRSQSKVNSAKTNTSKTRKRYIFKGIDQKIRKTFRKDVDFDDAFDSWSNFGRFLFEESGRQLPIFAGMIATGGTASALGAGTYLSAAAAGSVIGVQSAGQQIGDMTYQDYLTRLDDLDYNDKNTSDLHKMLVGTGFGLAEGALGVAPTFIIGKTALSGGFKALLKNQSDDLTMLTGKEYFKKNAFKEFAIGSGTTGNTSTSATPSFEIAIGDTNIYLLELTIIDNSGMSWVCIYPTLVYFDGGSWIALRTSQPGTTGIDNLDQAISNRKLLKIVDIMGRETEFKKNEVLFYMYDDGSTETKFFK